MPAKASFFPQQSRDKNCAAANGFLTDRESLNCRQTCESVPLIEAKCKCPTE